MGILTLSLDDEIERELREIAKALFGEKKGSIKEAITLAVKILKLMRNTTPEKFFNRYSADIGEIKRERLWE